MFISWVLVFTKDMTKFQNYYSGQVFEGIILPESVYVMRDAKCNKTASKFYSFDNSTHGKSNLRTFTLDIIIPCHT